MVNQSSRKPETIQIAGIKVLLDNMIVTSHDDFYGQQSCNVVALLAKDPESIVLIHLQGVTQPLDGCKGIVVTPDSLIHTQTLDDSVLNDLLDIVLEAKSQFKGYAHADIQLESLHETLHELVG